MRLSALFLLLLPLESSGLILQPIEINNKGLTQVIDAQQATPLNIQLDVGVTDDSRLSINGMIWELSSKETDYDHPKMPGANGHLSSGVRSLNLLQDGSFVSMSGTQTVKIQDGCWEMVWDEKAESGRLICGVNVPQEYFRNDASLPKGHIYISFPVWTRGGLTIAQDWKHKSTARVKELLGERDEALAKMDATWNPISKALHYRDAANAIGRYRFYDTQKMDLVPSNDGIIPLQDGLLLATKGLVTLNQDVLLGTAYASPVVSSIAEKNNGKLAP